MIEAIIGIVGVLIGSGITFFQWHWTDKRANDKSARYLAVRIVCIFDKFMEDSILVIKDAGYPAELREDSQARNEPRIKCPGPPKYPDDVDWKSINHELMYRILSLPSEVEVGDRLIEDMADIARPPELIDLYLERAFWYSTYGLEASRLSAELCDAYGVKRKKYSGIKPAEFLEKELQRVAPIRQQRLREYASYMNRVLRGR